jgi:3-hydroxyacyl-[acyl-carrier-protein] dehydratase
MNKIDYKGIALRMDVVVSTVVRRIEMADVRPQTLDQVKLLLRRDLKLGADIAIPDDMPFSGTEADFDSLDILLLLSSIEKQFKIKIPSEAVGKQVFRDVSTRASYIDEQLAQNTGAANAGNGDAGNGDRRDYLRRLPHRDPFRFLSKVTAVKEGESGEALWSLSGSEPFFAGHFPGNPLVPGVLIAEAMAQLSGLVGPVASDEGKLVHVDVRFDKPVIPPAEVVLRSRLLRTVGVLEQFEVSAAVGDATVARGMLTLSRPRAGVTGGTL